jgi:hypothetical protein
MEEGSGGRGWEKLGPEERKKLRNQTQYRGRNPDRLEDPMTAGQAGAPRSRAP